MSGGALHLPQLPADAEAQAGFWGIGLYTGPRRHPRELCAPAPYRRTRHTAAHWQFAEQIYQQITATSVSAPSTAVRHG
ncbi:hypothetical protein [Nocardia gipuzkoensis]|uniref:hypothetical protein n=1 Tax=Nocardia gipuzkoensis TaxID=2749991 RepID=UPI00237DA361|nr:hypothetical protein [Nocardia gipuzkoensis]MDE1674368.1 hypothetical protein [Nocardia gipuzkoensis]